MDATNFLRRYIDFMRFDKPQKSLPFILFTLMEILIEINTFTAILTETEYSVKIFLALQDLFIRFVLFCNMIKRNLNRREDFKKLLHVIEDDFIVSRDEFDGTEKLWNTLENYNINKRKFMEMIFRNLAAVFAVTYIMCLSRNATNIFIGFTQHSENKSINSLTPFFSYCPPEFDSLVFILYLCFLDALLMGAYIMEMFITFSLVCLSTERVLADFDTLHFLFNDLSMYAELNSNHQVNQSISHTKYAMNLRKNMGCIVRCHQRLIRNFQMCSEVSDLLVSIAVLLVMLYSCTVAYMALMVDDLQKRLMFVIFFIVVNMTAFLSFHNGQRIFNQNDILRQTLVELPWTDKPQWFKQTLLMMMIRANLDIEMKPYGIFTLNYMAFTDVMKTTFSIGNLLYSKKQLTGS